MYRYNNIIKLIYKKTISLTSVRNLAVQRKDFSKPIISYHYTELRILRGFKRFHRKPIQVIQHHPESEGKTVEEYAEKARKQTVTPEVDCYKSHKNYGPSSEVIDTHVISNEENGNLCDKSVSSMYEQPKINNTENHQPFRFLNIQIYEKARKRLKQYLESGNSPKLRYANNIFLVEGWRLIAEALAAGLKPEAIFYSRSRLLAQMASILSMKDRELAEFLNLFPVIKTPYQTLQTWSTLTNSPGITAAFKLSEANCLCKKDSDFFLPLIVILDEIRDPGNLGSIIRTLVAAGIEKIILMKGCCDLWDTKVLRAACGGHFHANFETRVQWSKIMSVLPAYPCVYIADAKVEQLDNEVNIKNVYITSSLSSSIDEKTDLLKLKDISIDQSVNQTAYEVDEENNEIIVNESYSDFDHLSLFSDVKLPISDYHDISYFLSFDGNSLVLIIGGETGLSNAAKKFAIENDGTQIFIPMHNSIQSINNAVTSSILVYEIFRQFKNFLSRKKDVT